MVATVVVDLALDDVNRRVETGLGVVEIVLVQSRTVVALHVRSLVDRDVVGSVLVVVSQVWGKGTR